MRIAALLPHVEVFGGVRRYVEVGNALVRRGHRFVLFTPAGEKPDWLEFGGEIRPFAALQSEEYDVGLCGEYSILPRFESLRARAKFFYFVLEGHKEEKAVARSGYHFLGSSEGICRRIERKYHVACFRAPGGINKEVFYPFKGPQSAEALPEGRTEVQSASGRDLPKREFRVLCYGRIYKKRKGVRQVIKAVERLRRKGLPVRLVFFDSLVGEDRKDPRPLIRTPVPHDFYMDLPQDRMAWLFSQADAYVGAERRAGWANTAAEAMACRLPVVCTASGSRDFAIPDETALVVRFPHPVLLARRIKRLLDDADLGERLADAGYRKIGEFTWDSLAARLEAIFRAVLSVN
jgi:glycosyltransferase involved in cell wall biosynthesis